MRVGSALVGLWMATACAALPAAANQIVNGDFETGDATGWSTATGAAVLADTVYQAAGGIGSFPVGHFVASFGSANLPAGGTFAQDFPTVAGQAYSLSFEYGKFQALGALNSGEQSLALTVVNPGDGKVLLSDSVASATADPSAAHLDQLFQTHLFGFQATGQVTRLVFSDTSPASIGLDGLLDNVDVEPVPEPGTLTLTLVGTGIGARLRRRSC